MQYARAGLCNEPQNICINFNFWSFTNVWCSAYKQTKNHEVTLYSSTIYDAILLCFRDVVIHNATTIFFDFQATK